MNCTSLILLKSWLLSPVQGLKAREEVSSCISLLSHSVLVIKVQPKALNPVAAGEIDG